MQYFGFDRPSFGIKTFGFGHGFRPLELFVGGKQGIWYDPSDLSTLFQDVAGTIPVTANGDPVGMVKDKSGNNNHATQTLSTARPIYQTDGILHWLYFDGVDDYLPLSYPLGLYEMWTGNRAQATYNFAYYVDYRTHKEQYIYEPPFGVTDKTIGIDLLTEEIITPLEKNKISGFKMNFSSESAMLFIQFLGKEGFRGRLYGLLQTEHLAVLDRDDVKKYLAQKSGVIL